MSAFARLEPAVQEMIARKLGWSGLRPVQELTIDAVLGGNNCIVLAPTAGGKTEAALFPVLSACLTRQESGVRVLYVCPTRALLNNQQERIGAYAEMLGLGAFKWHGDVTATEKQRFLADPCEVLLTTPESLEVMLVSGKVPSERLFRHVAFVIIDEIHALAACDRGNHLLCVLERIRAFARSDFQRIGLSATVGNPEDILAWQQGGSTHPQLLVDPPSVKAAKKIDIALLDSPLRLAEAAVGASRGVKSLLFCESRSLTEKIAGRMQRVGETVFVHHSSLSREEREDAEKLFFHGQEACIVCTSTMELGIDVGDLDKVLQVDAPGKVSSFLQRMGRTGRRAGTVANTSFFVGSDESLLQAIALVELARTHWVEHVRLNARAWHILLHQLMALCLERGAITPQLGYDLLQHAWCLSGIDRAGYDRFIDFLLAHEFLHDDGGMLSMGLAAEKAFGRKNFMELYAVFSTPSEFTVCGLSGDPIGSIEWTFLDKLLEEDASFYLAGKAWVIDRIEWKKKLVIVRKAPAGAVPKWGGGGSRLLEYEICRMKYTILTGDTDYPYLDGNARDSLAALRADLGGFLGRSFAPILRDDKGIKWWTWAGGFVNNSLRYALQAELNVPVTADNECLKIKCGPTISDAFQGVLKKMCRAEYWEDPVLLEKILLLMPGYRLSKFQPYLPRELQLQLVADSILDLQGVKRFINEGGAEDLL